MDLLKFTKNKRSNKHFVSFAFLLSCFLAHELLAAPGDAVWPAQSLNGNIGSSIAIDTENDQLYVGSADNTGTYTF